MPANGPLLDFTILAEQQSGLPCTWAWSGTLDADDLGRTVWQATGLGCSGGDAVTDYNLLVTIGSTDVNVVIAANGPRGSIELFNGTITKTTCVDEYEIDNTYDDSGDTSIGRLGTCALSPGDKFGAGSCPGGSPIFISKENTSLAPFVGEVVKMGGICYTVSEVVTIEPTVPFMSFTDFETCEDCCDA